MKLLPFQHTFCVHQFHSVTVFKATFMYAVQVITESQPWRTTFSFRESNPRPFNYKSGTEQACEQKALSQIILQARTLTGLIITWLEMNRTDAADKCPLWSDPGQGEVLTILLTCYTYWVWPRELQTYLISFPGVHKGQRPAETDSFHDHSAALLTLIHYHVAVILILYYSAVLLTLSNSILIKTAVPLNLILYPSAVLLTLIHCHIAVLLIFYYSAVLLTLSLSYSCSFNSNPLSQCSSNTYPLSHSCSFNPLLQCSSSNSISLHLVLHHSVVLLTRIHYHIAVLSILYDYHSAVLLTLIQYCYTAVVLTLIEVQLL